VLSSAALGSNGLALISLEEQNRRAAGMGIPATRLAIFQHDTVALSS